MFLQDKVKKCQATRLMKFPRLLFVPTTSTVVTGDVGGEVRLWDAEELRFNNLIRFLQGSNFNIKCISIR